MTPRSLRRLLMIAALLLAGFGALLWRQSVGSNPPKGRNASRALKPGMADLNSRVARLLPGEEILKNYASAATRPEDDLHAMAHVFSSLQLLAKGDSPFQKGANEEFAAALLGHNSANEVFLKAPHACLNAKGQLVDRWGTPLFFHVRDRTRIDIRSAGLDRQMWSADDLQRQHGGEFVRGAALTQNP